MKRVISSFCLIRWYYNNIMFKYPDIPVFLFQWDSFSKMEFIVKTYIFYNIIDIVAPLLVINEHLPYLY